MEAKGLRIGNWVSTNGDMYLVVGVGYDELFNRYNVYVAKEFSDIATLVTVGIEPIPLTEEILLKCGFEKINGWNEFVLGDLRCEFRDGDIIWFYPLGVNVIYLHQLQNLVFALTNEELKIEL